MPDSKVCSCCKQLKPYSEYHKRSAMKDGHRSACKQCARKTFVKCVYGLSHRQYEDLLKDQGGRCAVCKGECRTGQQLAIDHCHETGEVRGLLCNRCNRAIGLLCDDHTLVQSAADYLKHRRSN